MSNDGSSFLGLDLADAEWLRNHFLSKGHRRLHFLSKLAIRPGDRVLDACCGPGHFSELFAILASPGGQVVGLDLDPSHVDEAERRIPFALARDGLRYYQHDISTSPLPSSIRGDRFDVIVLFNCLCYFSDPQDIVSRYCQLLRPGGRIIVRDSDLGHFFVTPFNHVLQGRLIEAAMHDRKVRFNNFLGRRLPNILRNVPNLRISVDIWSYPMTSPLTEEEKTYISVNLMLLLQQAQPRLDDADVERWRSWYDRSKPEALIHQNNFFFLMHEVVATGVFIT